MNDLEKRAILYAKTLQDQPPLIAKSSTATGLYCEGKPDPIFEYTNNPELLIDPIYNELKANPSLDINDFKFFSNSVDGLIKEARDILIKKILGVEGNPMLNDKEKVINNTGEALDIQLGRDKVILDKSINTIYKKLKTLGIDDWLVGKYEQLHPYYLATKHGDKIKFTEDLRLLGEVEGRMVTIKFFETVRQILQIYFEKKGYTLPQELYEIDYSIYGFEI
jgi:hypothetical protein